MGSSYLHVFNPRRYPLEGDSFPVEPRVVRIDGDYGILTLPYLRFTGGTPTAGHVLFETSPDGVEWETFCTVDVRNNTGRRQTFNYAEWVRITFVGIVGATGYKLLLLQRNDGLPLTSRGENARLPVDSQQTSQEDGEQRAYRIPVNLASGTSTLIMRFTCAVDFKVLATSLECFEGVLKVEYITNPSAVTGTATGTLQPSTTNNITLTPTECELTEGYTDITYISWADNRYDNDVISEDVTGVGNAKGTNSESTNLGGRSYPKGSVVWVRLSVPAGLGANSGRGYLIALIEQRR